MQFENSSFLSPARIDLREGWEMSHWCDELNLRHDELQEIINEVGSSLEAVREHLVRRSMQRESTFS